MNKKTSIISLRRIMGTMCLLLSLTALSQTVSKATKVLDYTAETIKACGDLKLDFTASQFKNFQETGSSNGTMLLSGKRLKLSTPQLITWYDGKTQWNYIVNANEVDVSYPTKKEMTTLNPYSFLNVYKRGYRATMRETTLRDQPTYEVHLVARFKNMDAQEIYIDIRQEDYIPLCIRIRQDDEWTRIALNDIKINQNFSDSEFVFNKQDYPSALFVDLR